ncbi:MAG: outer membrane beta-barrel protein [Verrucomicrobiota bacterium]
MKLLINLLTLAIFVSTSIAQRHIPSAYGPLTDNSQPEAPPKQLAPTPAFRADIKPRQSKPRNASAAGKNATGHSLGVFGGISPIQNHFQETTIGGVEDNLDDDEDNISWLVGLKYGYDFPFMAFDTEWIFGLEIEGFYLNHEVDATTFGTLPVNAEMDVAVGLANLLLKKDIGRLRPYVGLGIGAGHAWVDEATPLNSDYESALLAFQVPVGAELFVTDRFALSLDYRLLILQGIDDQLGASETELDVLLHTFTAGLRTYF